MKKSLLLALCLAAFASLSLPGFSQEQLKASSDASFAQFIDLPRLAAPFARPVPSASEARRLDVPHRVQKGPTCGLYALGMVMDYYFKQNPANETAYVVADDASRPDADTVPPNTSQLIFQTAEDAGYFAAGEQLGFPAGGMFVADQLGLLSEKFGYRYTLIDNAQASDIRSVIDRGHPALVAFDVDDNGEPFIANGTRPHWCVVVGYYSESGTDWFIVQHGWTTKEYRFRAADFIASMSQVQPTLRDKIVEVFPGAP